MFFIKHILVDLYIKNNDEELSFTNIDCIYKNNKLIFSINEDNYDITKKENIIFHKENKESIIDFEFKDNVLTKGTYFIKDLNFYMDANIKTIKYIVENNIIDIEYKLWLQDEEIGEFILKIKVKE